MMTGLPHVDHPSPNYAKREHPVRFIILHGTWMASDKEALERLCDVEAEVSCHYFICQQGNLYRLVEEEHVAWHAGASRWGELESLNAHSIGIEISNPGEDSGVPYHEAQYHMLEKLLADIMQRHNIPPENVLGHSDIAPERKTDPGRHFNWKRLADKSLACLKRILSS